jgi:putative Mg2+ transporter-C (MgtC) family protein
MFDHAGWVFLGQMILSIVLGGVLGWERERIHKPAGLRTYILVCMGSLLYTKLSQSAVLGLPDGQTGDPTRIASQILTGIGFIGAGVIMKQSDHVVGITTAAGLWLSAAVGMAIGFDQYLMAISTAVLGVVVLLILRSANINDG